jgi:molybdopterin-guanine dinucleotide biosynthesis protein A
MIDKNDVTGLILAGGRGTRMGGADKGLQTFRGMPLALYTLLRLAPQVGEAMINANRNLSAYESFGVPVWPDSLADYPGPLAGFLTGLERCETPYLVTVPCDTPLFPTDLVARLGEALEREGADIAMAGAREEDGQLRAQPVFSLLRLGPQVGEAMVNANRNLAAYESFGVPVWPDASADYAGPLAGFLVGLERCETAYLVTVPCDTPLFPTDLVARLAEAMEREGADIAMAAAREEDGQSRPQPVFSLLRHELMESLVRFTTGGGRKIDAWTAQRWAYADGGGEVGVISSVTQAFCGDCNRARLSTEGKLYLCLFAGNGYDLRSLLRGGASDAELASAIGHIWQGRGDRYSELRGSLPADAATGRRRVEMSYIGG